MSGSLCSQFFSSICFVLTPNMLLFPLKCWRTPSPIPVGVLLITFPFWLSALQQLLRASGNTEPWGEAMAGNADTQGR